MSSERRQSAAAMLVALSLTGCGYGVLQTAHTEPPGKPAVTVGAATVSNEYDAEARRNPATNAVPEASLRLGLTEHLDVGTGPYLLTGWRADVKGNLFRPAERHALAPRAGVAYATLQGDRTLLAFVGVIGSYRVARWFEPYGSLTMADNWVRIESPTDTRLAPNEAFVDRDRTGNGNLQAVLGAELSVTRRWGFLLEYGRWTPLWNDPGDFYRFAHNNVFAAGARFSAPRWPAGVEASGPSRGARR